MKSICRILSLFLITLPAAAHEHIDTGAETPSVGSKLTLINAEDYLADANYVWRMEFQFENYFPAQYGTDELSFTSLPATAFWGGPAVGHAVVGSRLQVQFVRVIGPAGASFGYWEGGHYLVAASPTVQFAAGASEASSGAGLHSFLLTEGYPQDPAGHIHDRAYSANQRGIYLIDFRLKDAEGLHLSSDVKRMIFQATPKRTQSSLLEADVTGLTTSVTYDGTSKPVVPVTNPAGLQTDILYGESLTAPTLPGVYTVRAFINEANYEGTGSGVLTIEKLDQEIDFPAITTEFETGDTVPLVATSDSGLDVEFSVVSGPGEIASSGTDVEINGPGAIVIRASQPGNTIYKAAPSIQQTISTATEAQTITWGGIGDREFSTATISLTASASSGLPVQYTTAGPARVSGAQLFLTGLGTVTVMATQPGNESFSSTSSTQQFQVSDRSAPTLTAKKANTSRSRSFRLSVSVADNLGVNQIRYTVIAPGKKSGARKTKRVNSNPGALLKVGLPISLSQKGTYKVILEASDATGNGSARKTVTIRAK